MKRSRKLFAFLTILVLTCSLFAFNIDACAADEADFDQFLTDGKFVVNSAPATNGDWMMTIAEIAEYRVCEVDGYHANIVWDSNNEPVLDELELRYLDENHNVLGTRIVEISYNYDTNIQSAISGVASNALSNQSEFKLTDMEFINYLKYGHKDIIPDISNYCGELRKKFNNKNFNIDIRQGEESAFYTVNGGNFVCKYDDTIYYVDEQMAMVEFTHIIYVEDDATDLVAAVEKRLSDTFGENDISVEDTGKIVNDYIETQYPGYVDDYSLGEYINYPWFKLTINGSEYNFIIIKDSSKINNEINYLTSDINTNISISTDSANIPLDTLIRVNEITSGAEYDRIKAAIGADTMETYDLTLKSNSLGGNVTELEDGTFEVEIPLNDSLKGETVAVYYVDESGKVTEYDVADGDNSVIFNTNHFSIYTIAKKVNDPVEDNTTTTTTEATTAATTQATTEAATTTEKTTETTAANTTVTTGNKSPQTSDPVEAIIILMLISVAGMIAVKKTKRI